MQRTVSILAVTIIFYKKKTWDFVSFIFVLFHKWKWDEKKTGRLDNKTGAMLQGIGETVACFNDEILVLHAFAGLSNANSTGLTCIYVWTVYNIFKKKGKNRKE